MRSSVYLCWLQVLAGRCRRTGLGPRPKNWADSACGGTPNCGYGDFAFLPSSTGRHAITRFIADHRATARALMVCGGGAYHQTELGADRPSTHYEPSCRELRDANMSTYANYGKLRCPQSVANPEPRHHARCTVERLTKSRPAWDQRKLIRLSCRSSAVFHQSTQPVSHLPCRPSRGFAQGRSPTLDPGSSRPPMVLDAIEQLHWTRQQDSVTARRHSPYVGDHHPVQGAAR